MSRIFRGVSPLAAAVGITIFIIIGIASQWEGLTLEQILQAVNLPWLKTTVTPNRLTLREYAGEFPLVNLAGVESNDQNSSLADIYGTLVKIDKNKSMAVVNPQTPDYIEAGPGPEKESQDRIVILFAPDTKIIDPFVEKTRNYPEMVSSRDGNLGRFIGSYVHIAVTTDTEGKLVAKEMAIAGVSR